MDDGTPSGMGEGDSVYPRKVLRLVEPDVVLEGAGVRLKRSMPTKGLDYADPFLLFDHFGSDNPADYLAGFPMHPHRGIETVTYMLSGVVYHRDTLGNSGSIRGGDVQWMTAGGGIMHEEMPKPWEGQMAGFQLWVNLPAKLKMMTPRYQEIPSASIPEVLVADGCRVRVIAGQVEGVEGAVKEIVADPTYLDVSVPPGGTFRHVLASDHTVLAYVFEGEGTFGATGHGHSTIQGPRMLVLGDGGSVRATATARGLRFLLLAGRPSHEPIARYGPFVMNTREEIEQALRDLRNGTFAKQPAR